MRCYFCASAKTSRGQVIKSAPVTGIEDEDLLCAFDVLALASWGLGAETAPSQTRGLHVRRVVRPALTEPKLCVLMLIGG